MVVRMTDDSLRLVSFDGYFPVGDAPGGTVDFEFSAEPGVTPTPPDKVPLYWANFKTKIPSGYSSIQGNLVFADYRWDETDNEATWDCDIFSGDVRLTEYSPAIYWGDESLNLELIST